VTPAFACLETNWRKRRRFVDNLFAPDNPLERRRKLRRLIVQDWLIIDFAM